MIRSMTGYGDAERQTEHGLLRVEIRTVNHRYLNPNVRTPPGFDRHEATIQGWLRPHLSRGHVTYTLTLERAEAERDDMPELDVERATRYRALLTRLKDELGLRGEVDVAMVARFGEIFRPSEPRRTDVDVDEDVLRAVTEEALRGVVAMRESEGARLQEDLRGRLAAMEGVLDRVASRAPERLLAERDRLREAVRELGGQEQVDEDRLAREVAYLAEKWDINEEIVRFRAHLEHFREMLAADASEPVGKRLSFLVQEMHREANTIGAKANDASIAHAAVGLKEEIERLREQLENVE